VKFAARRRPAPEINLTSLIDIMFTVMLFLLLTTTFSDFTSIGVVLPEAATGQSDRVDNGLIRVLVDESGAIQLGDRAVTLAEVREALAAVPDPSGALVQLAADARVEHGRVVAIMDVVRMAGISRLHIETRSPGGAASVQ